MRRNHAVTGRWIRIVAVVLGILCVLGAVPRREGSTRAKTVETSAAR
jgi:hypothetical protein|nr:hypothetical protein [Candidatus Acidoferrales bacterium]